MKTWIWISIAVAALLIGYFIGRATKKTTPSTTVINNPPATTTVVEQPAVKVIKTAGTPVVEAAK